MNNKPLLFNKALLVKISEATLIEFREWCKKNETTASDTVRRLIRQFLNKVNSE